MFSSISFHVARQQWRFASLHRRWWRIRGYGLDLLDINARERDRSKHSTAPLEAHVEQAIGFIVQGSRLRRGFCSARVHFRAAPTKNRLYQYDKSRPCLDCAQYDVDQNQRELGLSYACRSLHKPGESF